MTESVLKCCLKAWRSRIAEISPDSSNVLMILCVADDIWRFMLRNITFVLHAFADCWTSAHLHFWNALFISSDINNLLLINLISCKKVPPAVCFLASLNFPAFCYCLQNPTLLSTSVTCRLDLRLNHVIKFKNYMFNFCLLSPLSFLQVSTLKEQLQQEMKRRQPSLPSSVVSAGNRDAAWNQKHQQETPLILNVS